MKSMMKVMVLSLVSMTSFAFEYNTQMIDYKGGVISQLNNCGPTYSSSGRYLWGFDRLTADVDGTGLDVIDMYSVTDGVLSITSDQKSYFSSSGRNLSGGGSTKYLGIFDEAQAFDDTIYLQKYKRETVRGRGVGGRPGAPTTKVTITFTLIENPGKSWENKKTVVVKSPYGGTLEILGVVNNRIYLREYQFIKGNGRTPGRTVFNRIVSVTNLKDLETQKGSFRTNHEIKYRTGRGASGISNQSEADRIAAVKRILPYNGGSIAYGDTWITTSTSSTNVVYGSSTSNIYSNSRKKVSSILPRGGDSGRSGSSKGLLVAFKDGNSYWSPNGSNLTGGGRTSQITQPLSASIAQEEMAYYLNNQRSPYIQRNAPLSVSRIAVALINKGGSADFAKNKFIGSGGTNANSSIVGFASEFNSSPATVKVYDKGWSGWEYKWRYKGTQTGIVEQYTEGQIVGETGIKLRTVDACAMVVVVETRGGKVEPIEFSWDIQPDGTFTSSPGRNNANNDPFSGFAAGQPDLSDYYPQTIFDKIISFVYNVNGRILDRYGKPVSGVPVYNMK